MILNYDTKLGHLQGLGIGDNVLRDFALKWIFPIAGGREKVTISILGFKKFSLLLSSVCHA